LFLDIVDVVIQSICQILHTCLAGRLEHFTYRDLFERALAVAVSPYRIGKLHPVGDAYLNYALCALQLHVKQEKKKYNHTNNKTKPAHNNRVFAPANPLFKS